MSEQSYLVSARKYRPQDWASVVGQSGITQTLQHSIESGQIAQAYLFCGPRGVGKTTSARIFARAINGFEAGDDTMSFNVFELDAASNNKVEDIRSIVDQVRIPPQKGQYKVYIIDEVHMLSQAAFNAFLKTLEEPPPHAVFILATTEKHKILPTILSRCQIFDFHRISVPDAVAHLQAIAEKEGVTAEPEALHVIADKADGALRDALSMFDQLVAFAGKNLTYAAVTEQLHVLDHDTYFELTDFALSSDIPSAMLRFNEVMNRGFDAHHFLTGWGNHLRNLMVCRDAQTLSLLEATEEVKARFQEQSQRADLFFIVGGLDILNQADVQFRGSQNQRLLVELALMQLCSQEAMKKKSADEGYGLMAPVGTTNRPASTPVPVAASAPTSPPVAAPAEDAPHRESQAVTPPPVDAKTEPIAVAVERPKELLTPPSPVPVHRASGLRKSKKMVVTEAGGVKAKAQGDGQAGAESLAIDESWADPVAQDGVAQAWQSFTEKLRAEERIALVATLSANEPVLQGMAVQFPVNNPLQKEQMDGLRTELLMHLKTTLRNANLELHLVLQAQEVEEKVKFLSDRDRYDMMAEKNPSLDKLRKALDLDLG
jgi:DNA polymerase-3 subunit gamma/tau